MRLFAAVLAVLLLGPPCNAQPIVEEKPLAREIFKQLIEINTSNTEGETTPAAEAMAVRFREAGYPDSDIQVLGATPQKKNVVVRLHGSGAARPVLFIGHLDVVEAKREDWSVDPFEFMERGEYFYGRGTLDMKSGDAILVATFIRLKQEGFQPARDMILALTADEEGGLGNGVEWLVRNRRDLIDAEFCVNSDGGGGSIKNGKHLFMGVQEAEKIFLSFRLEVTNAGGHSSLPRKDNAIYHLVNGLARLEKLEFPVHLFDVTRTELQRVAPLYPGQLGEDLKTVVEHPYDAGALSRLSAIPLYNALLRSTCVPTMLAAGHAENALPQSATAVVNCRMLPVDRAVDVERKLVAVLADPAIKVTATVPARVSKYIPMNKKVMAAISEATMKCWPGLPVIPEMSAGASDGVYLNRAGIPTYGVSGIFGDEDDVRAHGRDERVLTASFYDAVDFIYNVAVSLGRNL